MSSCQLVRDTVHALVRARQCAAIRLAAWVTAGVFMAGCGSAKDAEPEFSTAKALRTSSNLDSAAILSATIAMRQFLDASREGSPTRDSLRALTACDDAMGDTNFPMSVLADYTLLPFDMHGDTVVARASVVTVAEQDIERRGSGFTARIRVHEDPLEWDVIPTDVPGQWVVCNGLRFGFPGADSLTTWRPEGASYSTVIQLVDSIVKARVK